MHPPLSTLKQINTVDINFGSKLWLLKKKKENVTL